jgi:hypothetical protein
LLSVPQRQIGREGSAANTDLVLSRPVRGGFVATIPIRNVRIAEQQLNLFGTVDSTAIEDFDPLGDLRQAGVGGDGLRPVRSLEPIKRRGDIEEFAADFEVNSIQNGRRGEWSGHGGVSRGCNSFQGRNFSYFQFPRSDGGNQADLH